MFNFEFLCSKSCIQKQHLIFTTSIEDNNNASNILNKKCTDITFYLLLKLFWIFGVNIGTEWDKMELFFKKSNCFIYWAINISISPYFIGLIKSIKTRNHWYYFVILTD